MRKNEVLLLEHSTGTIECITAVLGPLGLKVNGNTDANEALRKAALGKYDLVIADHNPPELNGCEFVQKFREKNPKTPLIVIANDLDPEFVSDISEYGVASFFPKPLRLEKFTKRVNLLLSKHQENLPRFGCLSNTVTYFRKAKLQLKATSAGFSWTACPWPTKSGAPQETPSS